MVSTSLREYLRNTQGVTDDEATTILGLAEALTWAGFLATPFFGWLSDQPRIGRRGVLMAVNFLNLLTFGVILVAPLTVYNSWFCPTLHIAAVLQGAFGSASFLVVYVYVSEFLSDEGKSRGLAFAGMWWTLSVLVIALTGWLAFFLTGGSWRVELLAMLGNLVYPLVALFWMPESPRFEDAAKEATTGKTSLLMNDMPEVEEIPMPSICITFIACLQWIAYNMAVYGITLDADSFQKNMNLNTYAFTSISACIMIPA